jgi:hypothetical protein
MDDLSTEALIFMRGLIVKIVEVTKNALGLHLNFLFFVIMIPNKKGLE